LRGRVAVELYRRQPAMLPMMDLGGHSAWSGPWAAFRRLLLSLHAPPRLLARLGFLLPSRWARRWFPFIHSYSYWRGVRGAIDDPELWRRLKRGTLILMYHAFAASGERASRYIVPAKRFARQMAWLKKRGYNVISLAEYLDYRREHRFPPPKSVVITIDDGYADNDTVARPILEQLGLPATVFLVSSAGGENGWSEHGSALAGRPLLGIADVRRMLDGPIEFGAHTRSHPVLDDLEPAEAAEEVVGSKQDLEEGLGRPIVAFAYPYGSLNAEVREIVERAGFLGACGVRPGRNRPATDSFALNRIEISGTYTLPRFAATLLLGDTRLLLGRRRRSRPK
jgi:peptidoglycan/xylan/chitin deacetylase (PgdA/CDA1 family)